MRARLVCRLTFSLVEGMFFGRGRRWQEVEGSRGGDNDSQPDIYSPSILIPLGG
jgi:hypothetical protein